MKRRAVIVGLGGALLAPAMARDTVRNAQATAGDRFTWQGEEFVLSDILAPSAYHLHRDHDPFFDQSTAALRRLLTNTDIHIRAQHGTTRWGARIVVAAASETGPSLQADLVSGGFARVAPATSDGDLIDRLLAAERAARAARRGVWALREYRVFDARNADAAIGAFHLVEGLVKGAAAARGRYYVNFGADYRTDFTATAPSQRARRWKKTGLDLLALEGRRVRVRGFVQSINGPSIELSHEKSLEIVA